MAWSVEMEMHHVNVRAFVKLGDEVVQISGIDQEQFKHHLIPIAQHLFKLPSPLSQEWHDYLSKHPSLLSIAIFMHSLDLIQVRELPSQKLLGAIQTDGYCSNFWHMDTCVEFVSGPHASGSKMAQTLYNVIERLANFDDVNTTLDSTICLKANKKFDLKPDIQLKCIKKIKTPKLKIPGWRGSHLEMHQIELARSQLYDGKSFFTLYPQYNIGIRIEHFFVSDSCSSPLLKFLNIAGKNAPYDLLKHINFLTNLGKIIQSLPYHICAKGIFSYLMYYYWQTYFSPTYYGQTAWKNAYLLLPKSGIGGAVTRTCIKYFLKDYRNSKDQNNEKPSINFVWKQIFQMCQHMLTTNLSPSWLARENPYIWATWTITDSLLPNNDVLPGPDNLQEYHDLQNDYCDAPLRLLVNIIMTRIPQEIKGGVMTKMEQLRWFSFDTAARYPVINSEPLVKIEARQTEIIKNKENLNQIQSDMIAIEDLEVVLSKKPAKIIESR